MPNDLKEIILKTSIKYGDEKDFDLLVTRIRDESAFSYDSIVFFRALTYTQNYELLQYLLNLLTDEMVRNLGESELLSYIAKNPIGKSLFFEYINENWNVLFERVSQSFFTLNELIDDAFSRFNSPADLRKLESFMGRNKDNLGVAESRFKDILEQVKANVKWMDDNLVFLSNFLKVNQ
jgi:hypothetical protein